MVRLKIVLVAVILAGATSALPTHALAATRIFYASPTGSDGARGSLADPFGSVSRAMSVLRPGDTLYLRGGTYQERVTGRSGAYLKVTPGQPTRRVTVSAYPGERPVIRGVLWITDMDFWTFHDVDVTWADGQSSGEHMVRFKNGRGWVFQNSEVWGARGYSNINVTSDRPGEPASWVIRRNCIHDNFGDPSHGKAKDQLLYVNSGLDSGPGVIARNLIFNAPQGKGIKLAGPDRSSGSADVSVRYNTIYNTSKPAITVGGGTTRSRIYRNLVVRTEDKALIRGFRLDGAGNAAWDNGWAQGPRAVVSDAGFRSTIEDRGGNIRVVPGFGAPTCAGLRPGTSRAAAFGRYAR